MGYKRKKGLVSVVITNYNNENYIRDCLDSILNQTYTNIEIILVNDASSDKSVSVINTWINDNKKRFPTNNYITLINLPRNIGFSGCSTVGLFACKGEFIAFQDGDDISQENRIKKQVDFLSENENINAVGSNYAVFHGNDFSPTFELNGIVYGIDEINDIYACGGHCVCYGTVLFRGEIFDKIGGLSRNLNLVEDYEYITKLLPYGIDNIDEILYYYREHKKQRSKGLYTNLDTYESSDKLRVLIALDKFNIGGTETHILSLTKALIDNDVEVVLVCGDGPLKKEFENLNCKIYDLDFPLVVLSDKGEQYMYESELKKIISLEQIDLVHAHQSPSGSICLDLCNKLKIPCIFTVHGLYYEDIVKEKLKLATKVISVSKPVYDWLLDFDISSTLIPNFIDFDNFNCFELDEDIRDDLNINKDAFVVLYCARLAWGKSLVARNVINACRDIKRLDNIDIHTIIIGDGPDFDKISNYAKMANNILNDEYIHLLGSKTSLEKYYMSCDCVVGTGRVAIESMASKKPIIASGNLGYFGFVNNNNLEDAWESYFADHKLDKTNSTSYLYNDLKYLFYNKNKLKTVYSDCNSWAKEKFDTSKNIKDILNLYQDAYNK